MPLIFDQVNPAVPQTHVFLVGVGNYPYLRNGERAVAQQDPELAGLGQLSSPQVSIAGLYDTILKHAQSWRKPLGSIDVLLSPISTGKKVFEGKNLLRATRENISNSYFAWKDRCSKHKDNVAIFYFCGHGLGKSEHFLLAEDFGQNPNNPYDGAFAFDKTRMAFNSCIAETHIFFVDACREVTSDMLMTDLSGVAPLENPKFVKSESKYHLTMKAAATNEQSFGRVDSLSIFSEAIINGLNLQAVANEDQDYLVSTGSISSNIFKLIRDIDPKESYPQRCVFTSGESTDLIMLKAPPEVNLTIQCTPDEAHELAALNCKHVNTAKLFHRDPGPSPWSINVDIGIYEIEGMFQNGAYPNFKKAFSVEPPSAKAKFRCI